MKHDTQTLARLWNRGGGACGLKGTARGSFPTRWLTRASSDVRRFGKTSTVGAEDVHPSHVEVARSLQHVAVVRIDLVKAMFLGAGQV